MQNDFKSDNSSDVMKGTNVYLQKYIIPEIFNGGSSIGSWKYLGRYLNTYINMSIIRVSDYRSRGPGFHSRSYQIFWEVGGLKRGPLSLVRTIEELFEWKSRGSGVENRD
jgi:hypothetical protein